MISRDKNDNYVIDEKMKSSRAQLARYAWYSGSHSRCIHISICPYAFLLLAMCNWFISNISTLSYTSWYDGADDEDVITIFIISIIIIMMYRRVCNVWTTNDDDNGDDNGDDDGDENGDDVGEVDDNDEDFDWTKILYMISLHVYILMY